MDKQLFCQSHLRKHGLKAAGWCDVKEDERKRHRDKRPPPQQRSARPGADRTAHIRRLATSMSRQVGHGRGNMSRTLQIVLCFLHTDLAKDSEDWERGVENFAADVR